MRSASGSAAREHPLCWHGRQSRFGFDESIPPSAHPDPLGAELGHVAARTAAATLGPTAELQIPRVAGEDGQHAEMRGHVEAGSLVVSPS